MAQVQHFQGVCCEDLPADERELLNQLLAKDSVPRNCLDVARVLKLPVFHALDMERVKEGTWTSIWCPSSLVCVEDE